MSKPELYTNSIVDDDTLSVGSDSTSSYFGFDSLDQCLDSDYFNRSDMYSIRDIVRGHFENRNKRQKAKDERPVVFVRFNTRKGKPKPITLRALLDSGGSGCLVKAEHAKKLKLRKTSKPTTWSTPAGELTTKNCCRAKLIIPELHDERVIEWDFHVTKNMGAYDMIIGRDMLKFLGIDVCFSSSTIKWDEAEIPFKDAADIRNENFYIGDPESVEESVGRMKSILPNDYHVADLAKVCQDQAHLTREQQLKLENLLRKYEDLFDGTLGKFNQPDYKLRLKEGVKPYHARAFPIPKTHYQLLKDEVERLCRIGVLKRVNRSEWAAPTFIIPKKDGKLRFVSDFRELNKRIERLPYPIPHVQDMMLNLEGFQYATALDLNMGYYHVRLDPDSRKLCTIILPFGKFEYQRLPQGICNGPDIFQEKMAELFDGFEYVRAYIDDLLVLTKNSFDDHIEKLDRVFSKIREAGLKVNATKSFFARAEVEYLGYIITRNGIKPQPKKVEAIQRIAPPTTKKELRRFIGMVNYYRDMWERRSHLLAPLASLTSKSSKWKWTEVEDTAFKDIKNVIAREVMLSYPDFSKPFVIHTDASHRQLGAVISQEGKPIAFYSRKLNDAQTRYTTTERELLSIVETLKEFRNILLGHRIIVHTDHKNLTCKHFNTERVMRWRLVLEEYGPELRYIKGENNIVADALSRLDMVEAEDFHYINTEEYQAECFADTIEQEPYPLSYADIEAEQNKDAKLLDAFAKSQLYERKEVHHSDGTYHLIFRDNRIVVPKALQEKAVQWYHGALLHPGETRTELTIAQHYYWTNMQATCKKVCSKCLNCQQNKKTQRKFGTLPPKDPDVVPWKRVHVDTIGPYSIGYDEEKTTLRCMTMIDPATGWFEMTEVSENVRADEIANVFEMAWLNRYPWPEEVVVDRGSEFKAEFIKLLEEEYGIKRKPITTRNPQSNAMVERAHQTIQNLLKSKVITKKSDLPDGKWDGILSAVCFAMRSTVHTTNRATPSQLVFGRDAMLNVNFEADWQYIKERKQRLIVQNNKRENSSRIPHTYHIGDQVMVLNKHGRKYSGEPQYEGPQTVSQVYDNGTVKLTRATLGGAVSQTWNIRNIKPYRG